MPVVCTEKECVCVCVCAAAALQSCTVDTLLGHNTENVSSSTWHLSSASYQQQSATLATFSNPLSLDVRLVPEELKLEECARLAKVWLVKHQGKTDLFQRWLIRTRQAPEALSESDHNSQQHDSKGQQINNQQTKPSASTWPGGAIEGLCAADRQGIDNLRWPLAPVLGLERQAEC